MRDNQENRLLANEMMKVNQKIKDLVLKTDHYYWIWERNAIPKVQGQPGQVSENRALLTKQRNDVP